MTRALLPLIAPIPQPAPRCKGCGKPLRAVVWTVYEQTPHANGVGFYQKPIAREFKGWNGYDGFHSLRCALGFAVAAYDAGFRTVPHE